MLFLDLFIERMHRSIYHHEDAINYLKKRNVIDEEIKEFKIGYSHLSAVDAINDGSEDYRIFREETCKGKIFERKILFPIYNILGIPVGLVGRSIENKEFKLYLTNEAKFTGVLFGLYSALPSIYETGRVFIVEGPFDFFAFRKVFPNVVSCLTADLTESQYEILSFFAKEIIAVFDSDRAGMMAANRVKKRWPDIRTLSLGFKDPSGSLQYYGDFDSFSDYVKRKVREISWN